MVRWRYTCGAVEVARRAVEIRLWCGQGTLVVQSRYACGADEVRSWCPHGELPVRFHTVRYLNFLLSFEGDLYKCIIPKNLLLHWHFI